MGTNETKIINQDITQETEGGIGRRDFLKGAAIGAMGMGAMASFFGCDTPKAEAEPEEKPNDQTPAAGSNSSSGEVSSLTGWAGTPAEIAALGGSTMPLADLNAYRQAYVDAQTDYTCEDGTVIPAVFVKVRSIINTYGIGCGDTPYDGSFDGILDKFTEDDAQAFVDMPMGEKFTAIDLYERTGRSIEECAEICKRIADAGYLSRFVANNGVHYHQVPFFQGVVEYQFGSVMANPEYSIGVTGADYLPNSHQVNGTPVFYAMPCDESVVSDGTILPYDDIIKIIQGKTTLGIAPCYCRYTALAKAGTANLPTFEDFATGQFEDYFSEINNLRVETCLMIGDEADYWIEKGFARKITEEEAIAFMLRSRDDGFILESNFAKDTGTVCSCRLGGCGIIDQWLSLGSPEAIGESTTFQQISHYNLEVDLASCIACGTCAERCPVEAISMDSGALVVNEMCFRCGQCAYVCPEDARMLVLRPEDEILELPKDFHDDNNMKAAYRFEHGLVN